MMTASPRTRKKVTASVQRPLLPCAKRSAATAISKPRGKYFPCICTSNSFSPTPVPAPWDGSFFASIPVPSPRLPEDPIVQLPWMHIDSAVHPKGREPGRINEPISAWPAQIENLLDIPNRKHRITGLVLHVRRTHCFSPPYKTI